MTGMTAPILAGLAVLYALMVLLSADPTPSDSAVAKTQERVSDLGSVLIQTVMLQQRQQQLKDHSGISDADRTMKVQQALKENGFYSGPVDGVMRKKTQEAIQSFQQSKHLKVTGTINDETARELRIH
jgi:peptidoglycan hydrolase-like protein with peptidoglycan-binding domain